MDTRQFLFNASGCAVGGEVRSPITQTLDSAASVALPITGGAARATAQPFQLQNILSYEGGSSEASGTKNADGSYHTVIETIVNALDLGGIVKADRIVGRLESNCKPTDSENCITAMGSQFVNLTIGGYPVTVELDLTLFCDMDTLDKFKGKYQSDASFKKMVQKRFLWDDVDANAPDWLKQRYSWVRPAGAIPESKGIVPCTIVKSVTCSNPNVQVFGNVLIVANFGVIFLGEIDLKANARRLTMMRVAMGAAGAAPLAAKAAAAPTTMLAAVATTDTTSDTSGDVTICGIEGNGSNYP